MAIDFGTMMHGLERASTEILPEQALWRAVVMHAVRDLITLDDSAIAMRTFRWVFGDQVDFPRVCELAQCDPQYIQTRMAALLKINVRAVAQGQPFLCKAGQGIGIRQKPKEKQVIVARYMLRDPLVAQTLAEARSIPGDTQKLMQRLYRETRADAKASEVME